VATKLKGLKHAVLRKRVEKTPQLRETLKSRINRIFREKAKANAKSQ